MNRVEILAMDAGEGLDKAVCNKIFNRDFDKGAKVDGECRKVYRAYSRNISAAFKVVDKMLEDGLSLELIIGADGNTLARFFDAGNITIIPGRDNKMVCESAPEAICKSALLTKTV